MIKVNRLLVLAGPRAVGKSWLLNKIRQQAVPRSLSDQLGLSDLSEWEIVNANQLRTLAGPAAGQMAVHYNMLRPWELNIPDFSNCEVRDALEAAEEIRFVTLWAPPEVLAERIRKRKRRGLLTLFAGSGIRARLNNLRTLGRIHALYRSGTGLADIYEQWFRFCNTFAPREHLILSVLENDWKLFPMSEWAKLKPAA